ncbi:hypothetical protein FRC04_006271 [Tulasnella sp. 424]|nr:hypothetical protein FRC04_006271 [Tulasnella sp. 424]KAG8961065.1 hypothetical protein FRC05_006397 [Tulasnella sp. 425]
MSRSRLPSLPQRIKAAAIPLPDISSPKFAEAFDTYAQNARVILLGECSHGTSEFYNARAAITRRLITKHGFNVVTVEADWPDAHSIDRYVRSLTVPPIPSKPMVGEDGTSPPQSSVTPFARFPTWMWRNTDVQDFVNWLKKHNDTKPELEDKAGFFGLDLYSLHASTTAVIEYLDRVDPEAAESARKRYGCLAPWVRHPEQYGLAARSKGYAPCEKEVLKVLHSLLKRQLQYIQDTELGDEGFMDAAHNAILVHDAEKYYQAMFQGRDESWNLRDTHMFNTLSRLLEERSRTGRVAKAVVWAHNSHIGDARFTGMGTQNGELNIGQLCRERFGDEAVLIGLGTHTGTVAAAHEWDRPMQIMRVRKSRPDSYEALMHEAGIDRFLLDLRQENGTPMTEREKEREEMIKQLMKHRLERFIGVIYRPDTERWSHYQEACLPMQFDAYVWFNETNAVKALPAPVKDEEPRETDETYPFGL